MVDQQTNLETDRTDTLYQAAVEANKRASLKED
jgi:hypothetical protein